MVPPFVHLSLDMVGEENRTQKENKKKIKHSPSPLFHSPVSRCSILPYSQ